MTLRKFPLAPCVWRGGGAATGPCSEGPGNRYLFSLIWQEELLAEVRHCLGECALFPRNISHKPVIYLSNCTEWDDGDLLAFRQNMLVYNWREKQPKGVLRDPQLHGHSGGPALLSTERGERGGGRDAGLGCGRCRDRQRESR